VRGALHAEWTKLRTLAGTGWLLLGTVAATAGVSVFAVESTSCRSGVGCPGDPATGSPRPAGTSWSGSATGRC